MMLQMTAYNVMDCWDAHVVAMEVTGAGRSWTQLSHDFLDLSIDPGDTVGALRGLARWLDRVADGVESR